MATEYAAAPELRIHWSALFYKYVAATRLRAFALEFWSKPSSPNPSPKGRRAIVIQANWFFQTLHSRHARHSHAAVGRSRADRRATGSQIDTDLFRHAPPRGHGHVQGHVRTDIAIDGACFQVRRVIVRHQEVHATVGRSDIQLFAIPTRARKFDVHAAIRS